MNFKKIIFLGLIFFISSSILLNSKNKIGLLCKNKELKEALIEQLSKYFIISSLDEADILICGSEEYIKECLKYNKKIIAINFVSYNLEKIKDSNIIAYFPINFKIRDVYNFIKYNINVENKCVLTHFDIKLNKKDVKIFKVKNIGEVPFILKKALKNCDLIIGIPDEIVFNYFSTRFLIKRIILNGKLFTGFSKEMKDLGAVYSFVLDIGIYVKKITNFAQEYFNNKTYYSKIFYPNFLDFKILENASLIKSYHYEVKK